MLSRRRLTTVNPTTPQSTRNMYATFLIHRPPPPPPNAHIDTHIHTHTNHKTTTTTGKATVAANENRNMALQYPLSASNARAANLGGGLKVHEDSEAGREKKEAAICATQEKAGARLSMNVWFSCFVSDGPDRSFGFVCLRVACCGPSLERR